MIKTSMLVAAVLLSAGCVQEPTRPLSESERAAAISALLSRPAPQPYQAQPYYIPPQPRLNVDCTTNQIGNTAYTHCN